MNIKNIVYAFVALLIIFYGKDDEPQFLDPNGLVIIPDVNFIAGLLAHNFNIIKLKTTHYG